MKNLILTIACICALSTISAQEQLKFSISGQIEGAERGDTLRFVTVSPDWSQQTPVFDIVVGRGGKVKYKGAHSHSQNYPFFYHPKDTTYKVHSTHRAGLVFITHGEITMEGSKEYIYLPTLKGGVYDEELQAINDKENSVSKERDIIFKRLQSIDRSVEPELAQQYSEEFNSFYSQEHIKEQRTEIKSLKNHYFNNRSNEYVAYELLTSASSSMPIDLLESYYNKQTQSVKESYYGIELSNKITLIKSLAPQMPAPDFSLTTTSGEVISNKDLLGRYILIYHYGMCPGSLSLDKRLSDWYTEHKDRVEVIGYTSYRESIVDIAKKTEPGSKMMGIDMYEAMQSMTNHPWKYEVDAGFDDANGELEEIYDFGGLPYFVFISPEGKIIDRGFKTFYNDSLKVVDETEQQ